ncbi:MAG: hypothetical protein ACREOW_13365 [Thermodesulfobacteriota bacterium]
MKCSSKTERLIGCICFISVALVMMICFTAGVAKADPFIVPDFESAVFGTPTLIDNAFFTLIPGTAFCYEADTEDGTETNEVTVVTQGGGACTLPIAGVQTIVVRDAVRLDGDLTEDTYDFYAQDNDGNVWYLGEATKECEDGNTEGTWNADQEGAEPGIVMLADPMPGNSYQQEFLEDVAEDMGKVLRLNANHSEYCEQGCLETKEWTPLAPGNIEHKYYAQGITNGIGGLVLVEELKGKTVMTELADVLEVNDTGDCPTSLPNALYNLCNEASPPPMNCE